MSFFNELILLKRKRVPAWVKTCELIINHGSRSTAAESLTLSDSDLAPNRAASWDGRLQAAVHLMSHEKRCRLRPGCSWDSYCRNISVRPNVVWFIFVHRTISWCFESERCTHTHLPFIHRCHTSSSAATHESGKPVVNGGKSFDRLTGCSVWGKWRKLERWDVFWLTEWKWCWARQFDSFMLWMNLV